MAAPAKDSNCVSCHKKMTPDLVKDYPSGEMGKGGIDCSACHGSAHQSEKDVAKFMLPTEDTCKKCHAKQHKQYMEARI